MSAEIRRSVNQVEADVQLLRRVAAILEVRYGDHALAARVDALGDDLHEQWCQAVFPDPPGEPPPPRQERSTAPTKRTRDVVSGRLNP